MSLFLLDYGAGNVQSLANTLGKLGHSFSWITSPADFGDATVSLPICRSITHPAFISYISPVCHLPWRRSFPICCRWPDIARVSRASTTIYRLWSALLWHMHRHADPFPVLVRGLRPGFGHHPEQDRHILQRGQDCPSHGLEFCPSPRSRARRR